MRGSRAAATEGPSPACHLPLSPNPHHPLPYPHAHPHAPAIALHAQPGPRSSSHPNLRCSPAAAGCGCRACPAKVWVQSLPRRRPGARPACFAHPLRGAFSLSGGCSPVVSRGIRSVAAPRGSIPQSRVNPQAAPSCCPQNPRFKSKLRPLLPPFNLHSTSKLHRAFPAPGHALPGTEGQEKSATDNSIQLKPTTHAYRPTKSCSAAALRNTRPSCIFVPTSGS